MKEYGFHNLQVVLKPEIRIVVDAVVIPNGAWHFHSTLQHKQHILNVWPHIHIVLSIEACVQILLSGTSM